LRPAYNVEVIAPASAKQVARSRPQRGNFIAERETPELYKTVTEPYIQALEPRATLWVLNLLNRTKEVERMLYNDPDETKGFLLNVTSRRAGGGLAANARAWAAERSCRSVHGGAWSAPISAASAAFAASSTEPTGSRRGSFLNANHASRSRGGQ
jgi:hypothetical protein